MRKCVITAFLCLGLSACGLQNPSLNFENTNTLSQHFCYLNSYGDLSRKPNYSQAYYWCSKSAYEGIASGQVLLAELYLLGNHVDQDFPTAFSLYQAAAEQGHPHAQQLVSIMQEKGLADNSHKN